MSLHDVMAMDLDAMLGDVAHGFSLTARLDNYPVRGILSKEFVEINGAESYAPTFRVAEAALLTGKASDIRHADTLWIDEPMPTGTTRYTVRGVQPDGLGEVLLILEKF